MLTVWRKDHKVPSNRHLADMVKKYKGHRHWFKKSRGEIKKLYGDKTDLFILFLAATSPRTSVRENTRLATREFYLCIQGKPMGTTLGLARKNLANNIDRIRNGQGLQGPKVTAFSKALQGDPSAITIDTWIKKIFHVTGNAVTKRDASCMSTVIRKVSSMTGYSPAQVQSCLWVYAKAELNGTSHREYKDFSFYLKWAQDMLPFWVKKGIKK